ncbi:metal ABC transporter substrate-binding protein [Pseudonocardiaceae bacterium YIM PH 21723]|nr:metal ABC transporter substrate-binding protein [Pseudonocardiaceae bacterium YIM PH 21723]
MARTAPSIAAALIAALTLTACGGSGTGTGDASGNGKIQVVASTNVWGDIVTAVGGDQVQVKSLISGANQDPHSYESTPADAVAAGKADLIVYNGEGYDEFAAKLAQQNSGKKVIQAFEVAGGKDNEHVWYSVPGVRKVAAKVAEQLGQIKPADQQKFTANLTAFTKTLDELDAKLKFLHDTYPGAKVLMTEPVAGYLVQDAGLADITPAKFVEAVEAGNDPSAQVIAEVNKLVDERTPRVLLFNPQTESPVTKKLREQVQGKAIPVVEVTELQPDGKTYAQWIGGELDKLLSALRQR